MYNQIKKSRIEAMKNKNEVAKAFYSTFMGEIEKEAKNAMIEPSDELVEKIAKKMAKNIQDNIKLYTERSIDVSKEQTELDIVSQYLPKLLSEDQTREVIAKIINSDNEIGSGGNIGKIMGVIKKECGNTVDMKLVSKLVRESLS